MGGMPGNPAGRALPKLKPPEAATGAPGWEVPAGWVGHRFGARCAEETGVDEMWRPGWMFKITPGFARSAASKAVSAAATLQAILDTLVRKYLKV